MPDIDQVAEDLEYQCFVRHKQIDQGYKKKISDVVDNLKLAGKEKDVAERIAIKKTMPIQKLLASHLAFQEGVKKFKEQLDEKRKKA